MITRKKGYDDWVYPCPMRTSGCMHRFFRLVKPRPKKPSSFSLSSGVSAHDIRYFISLFSSERAFSISGTVREQYISLRFVGWNCTQEMSSCDVILQSPDVPADMIRSGIRARQFSLSRKAFLGHSAPERPMMGYVHTLQCNWKRTVASSVRLRSHIYAYCSKRVVSSSPSNCRANPPG